MIFQAIESGFQKKKKTEYINCVYRSIDWQVTIPSGDMVCYINLYSDYMQEDINICNMLACRTFQVILRNHMNSPKGIVIGPIVFQDATVNAGIIQYLCQKSYNTKNMEKG